MLRRCITNVSYVTAATEARRRYARDLRFGVSARQSLLEGINVMADAVGTTLGPLGRRALIERTMRSPRITKDGITVADNVQLQDRLANMGAQLVRQAANNTNNAAGDGSSTTAILTRSMAKQGFELVQRNGVNPQQLRVGVIRAAHAACKELENMSQPVKWIGEVEAVARVALNGDEQLAGLIADAIHELGGMGVFLLRESETFDDRVEITESIMLEQGYISAQFVNQPKLRVAQYSNALLLLTLDKIEHIDQLLPALELARSMQQPLIIIAREVLDEALRLLVLNHCSGRLQVCAVEAPSFGAQQRDEMQDLAIATGATLFEAGSQGQGQLQRIQPADFGQLAEAVVSAKRLHMLQARGKTQELAARIDHIHALIDEGGTDEELEQLNERLGRLLASMAVVYVGGASELELSEKKDRMNDAIHAVRVAIRDGILPGGGTAYLRCIPALNAVRADNDDQRLGVGIVSNALRAPCQTILHNAGCDATQIIGHVLLGRGNYGYDAARQDYCDLVQRGIVDPTNVVRTALIDAAGIASLLATTEVLITGQPNRVKVPRNQVTRDICRLMTS